MKIGGYQMRYEKMGIGIGGKDMIENGKGRWEMDERDNLKGTELRWEKESDLRWEKDGS